jgi:2-polyprenyl-6-methoxyphenol hydroxylase-like FAD-dependent oxidoreductase
MSLVLFNWAHLYQGLRQGVPDEFYRRAAAVERIEARPEGPTLHLRAGGSPDFDLVVCADGYRSLGRMLIDPGAAPRYRESWCGAGSSPRATCGWIPLGGCDGVRPLYPGGHRLMSGPVRNREVPAATPLLP